jgi:hypothetical protein
LIVADDTEGPEFEEVRRPALSAGSRHSVYWAKREKKHELIVLDGKEEPDFEEVRFLNFNPDRERLAYAAKRGKKWLVVADGQVGKLYDDIIGGNFFPEKANGDTASSPTDFVYIAREGRKFYRVTQPLS